MGEMADFALEQMMDIDELQQRYASDEFSHDEADAHGLLDEFGNPQPFVFSRGPSAGSRTCRICGSHGLQWGRLDGKWRLFDGEGLHDCPIRPLK